MWPHNWRNAPVPELKLEDKTFVRLTDLMGEACAEEYENCVFEGCDFSQQNLSGLSFSDCRFSGCNLSNALVQGVVFKDVSFQSCKLLGVAFSKCRDFCTSLTFEDCILRFSSFSELKLRKTPFIRCELRDVSFFKTDLSGATFDRCDLNGALFGRTNLEHADFSTSFNYVIDPDDNRIRKAKFSALGLPGLLHKYDIEIE